MRPESMKLLGEVAGMAGSAVIGLLAVTDSTTLTVGSITAVLGFAGLLVNQIMRSQRSIWQIVAHKDAEITAKDHEIAYLRWERETLRYTYGERAMPPGQPPEPPNREAQK